MNRINHNAAQLPPPPHACSRRAYGSTGTGLPTCDWVKLAAAIEVLEDIERRHRPAADALKDWGLSHRFAGAGDRAAIGNIVYDALRRRRSAGWLLGADTPRAVGFGALLFEWRETAASLNEALTGDRFAPAPLDEAELAAIAADDLANAPPAVRADCPDWCAPLIEESFGADWVEECAGLAARPPLDLQCQHAARNPRACDRRAGRHRRRADRAGDRRHPHPSDDLYGVRIPPGVRVVLIQGRDQQHGWGGATVEVRLPGR